MNSKHIINVQSDNMLPIFSDICYDLLPHRLQEDVVFVIPYDEYVKFVKHIVNTGYEILTYPLKSYKDAINTRNEMTLMNLYLADLSRVNAFEVSLAQANQTNGTLYLHQFNVSDIPNVNFTEVEQRLYEYPPDIVTKSVHGVIENNMLLSLDLNNLTPHNASIIKYAFILRAMCYSKTMKMLNVII